MGGTVGITIRRKSGEEHRMHRWTNSLEEFTVNQRLLDQDEGHIDEYVRMWNEMVDGYNRGDKENMPMAWVYVPNAGLYPCEYGLIVVDYMTNTILAPFDDVRMGYIDKCSVDLAVKYPESSKNSTQDAARFKALFESGAIRRALSRDFKWIDTPGITMEDFLAETDQGGDKYIRAGVDMSPWKFRTYKSGDPKELLELKEEIVQMGFKLTEQEEKEWADHIEWRSQ